MTALEVTRLDAALFDVPADYVEAKSLLELTPSVSAGATLADALFGTTADGTSRPAPKRAGVARIGVLEPENKSSRSTLPVRALRHELVTRLTKAQYEALPLNGTSLDAVSKNMTDLQLDYVLLPAVVDVKSSKPGKVGGLMKMASGGGPAKERHEVKMAYRLYPADGEAAVRASGEVKADNGGGLSLGSALRVASFAGQMYMGFGGMRMMRGFGAMGGLGMGAGMMSPMYSLAAAEGVGALSGGFYDPRSMAMSSLALGYAGGLGGAPNLSGMPGFGGDPSDHQILEVATEAVADVARSALDKLKSTK